MRGENRIKTVPDQKFCGMEEATPALSLRNGSYFLFFRGIPLDNRGKKLYISRYGDPAGLQGPWKLWNIGKHQDLYYVCHWF